MFAVFKFVKLKVSFLSALYIPILCVKVSTSIATYYPNNAQNEYKYHAIFVFQRNG